MSHDNHITVFAKTNFRNREVPFGIKTDDRRRHMYLIGKTGMGKTTMMENMVIQDIRAGHGVAFLDPHGDSVQRILDCIPNQRVNDVIYFNPSDLEFPVAFNILEAVDAKFKHLVASGLMGVFTKIWANLWSARMEYILNNTILALLDSPGNTLLGITRMYVDKKYRKKIVDNIKDPMVRAFWVDEFANYNEKYRTEAIAPIQNKVGQFLSSGIIRNIVGQPKSTLDLREIMDNRKILIMDLSKGKVGEDNSALLGAMIVTKLQLAAMSRTDIPEPDRKDFYLYVDEFQNFATESFATILSEARKYRLNLIVGHQYIAQLEQDKNTKVRDAIFGNVGTIVCFRIGAADAEFLETEFEPIFTPNDLVNLPKYNIILKLMINGVASDPFSAVTVPYNPDWVSNNSQKVIKVSRERYANPVMVVEEKISRWMGAEFHQESAVLIGGNQNSEEATDISDSEKVFEQDNVIIPQILEQPPKITIIKPADLALNSSAAKNRPLENLSAPINTISNQTKTAVPAQQDKILTKQSLKDQSQNKDDKKKNINAQTKNSDQKNNKSSAMAGQPGANKKQEKNKQKSKEKFAAKDKKENPAWKLVADLHQQKKVEVDQKVKDTVHKLFEQGLSKTEKIQEQTSEIKSPLEILNDQILKQSQNVSTQKLLEPEVILKNLPQQTTQTEPNILSPTILQAQESSMPNFSLAPKPPVPVAQKDYEQDIQKSIEEFLSVKPEQNLEEQPQDSAYSWQELEDLNPGTENLGQKSSLPELEDKEFEDQKNTEEHLTDTQEKINGIKEDQEYFEDNKQQSNSQSQDEQAIQSFKQSDEEQNSENSNPQQKQKDRATEEENLTEPNSNLENDFTQDINNSLKQFASNFKPLPNTQKTVLKPGETKIF